MAREVGGQFEHRDVGQDATRRQQARLLVQDLLHVIGGADQALHQHVGFATTHQRHRPRAGGYGIRLVDHLQCVTIQPLLENAIYHGIELLPDGGEVHVTGKRDDKFLDIMISNPVARGEKRSKGGNQMALANIRQRFELAYGTRATVDVEADGSNYAVRLRFPHEVAA